MNDMSKKQNFPFFFIFLLLATLNLSSCIDLSATRLSSEQKAAHKSASISSHNAKKIQTAKGEVHTMRGGLGIFSIGMNQLRDSCSERFHVPSSSVMWYNAGKVRKAVIHYQQTHKKHRPIILIGHSLGANEQIKVARALGKAGVQVDLLVTVDAVSQTRVPPNVKYVLNVYKTGFVPMFSGLKLKAVDPKATQIENVNVDTLKGVYVNHFTIDKHQMVQEMILDKVEEVLTNAKRKEA